MIVIRGTEFIYKVSASISVIDEDGDENQAYQEVKRLLEKAGFTDVDVDLYDAQPNFEDLS